MSDLFPFLLILGLVLLLIYWLLDGIKGLFHRYNALLLLCIWYFLLQ